MTSLPFKLAVDPAPTQFLLTVRGMLAADTIEGGRMAHNQAAGSDQAVAGARTFGDLSHAVFVPVDAPASSAGELLIVDYWNSAEGLQTFFSDPQVQEGGKFVFKTRDPIVWQTSPALPRISLPAPAGKNDRYAGLARGPVQSRDAAEKILGESTRRSFNQARAKGLMSREFFFRLVPPGTAPSLELIGIDIWFDAEGMRESYADPSEMESFGQLFSGPPEMSVWKKPAGQWVEW